ncbi:MAG: hypothetical protein Fur0041_15530 [Bacteroidia bacterium]
MLSILLKHSAVAAVTDSVVYSSSFAFKPGVYLNYEQFRNNQPVGKDQLLSDYNPADLDYVRKIVISGAVRYKDEKGNEVKVNASALWGFSENNAVYIRFNSDFNRIMVMGSVCHFTATVTTYMSTGPTNMGGTYGTPVQSSQQFLLDTQTGKILDYNQGNVVYILQRDPALYAEYSALKKRKRKELMFYYIRKYNDRHPLKFRA